MVLRSDEMGVASSWSGRSRFAAAGGHVGRLEDGVLGCSCQHYDYHGRAVDLLGRCYQHSTRRGSEGISGCDVCCGETRAENMLERTEPCMILIWKSSSLSLFNYNSPSDGRPLLMVRTSSTSS